MADGTTRIINLPEATELNLNMNFVEDEADGSGTRRVTYQKLKAAINQDIADNLAPEYSNQNTYNIGDLCTYESQMYRCSTAIENAENWNASHWTATDVWTEIKQSDWVIPEMYGAVGDGVTDDAEALQAAVNAALAEKKRLVAGNATYLISTGISVTGFRNTDTLEVEKGANINIDLSMATIIYTGTDYAFTFSMIEGGEFRFGKIAAERGSGILLTSSTRFNYIDYFTISGGVILANSANDCITVHNTGTGWINQNKIDDVVFKSGAYATHFISESTNKINEWILENVSLEGVANGHYLEAHSENNIAIYIESIKFLYNRAVEHISGGKAFLKTYGRVQDCLIESYYGSFQLPSAYEFEYDSSGTRSYTHIATNIDIVSQNAKCKVANGKFISNPYMFDSACNITHITDISSDDVIYRNTYGTLGEFKAAIASLYAGYLNDTTNANLNTKWLAGVANDTIASRELLQTLVTQQGTEFRRKVSGGNYSPWLMMPVIKTETKVLNGNTFSVDFSAFGLLILTNKSTSYVAMYLVRFGTANAPIKIFSTLSNDWVITKTNNFTLSFSNSDYSTSEQVISFIQIG